MAQQSVAAYFNTKKRSAVEELKVNKAKKVLVLDTHNFKTELKSIGSESPASKKLIFADNNNADCNYVIKATACEASSEIKVNKKIVSSSRIEPKSNRKLGTPRASRARKFKDIPNQGNIQQLFNNIVKKDDAPKKDTVVSTTAEVPSKSKDAVLFPEIQEARNQISNQQLPNNISKKDAVLIEGDTVGSTLTKVLKQEDAVNEYRKKMEPPSTPTKKLNAMDKIYNSNELSMAQLKQKLSRSARLEELKASMARFKESSAKLKEAEAKTTRIKELCGSPVLKNFKTIEVEVNLSPQRLQSPEKIYLSPKKDTSVRKNLFSTIVSPSKTATSFTSSPKKLESPSKPSLTLPYRYRCLAEMFRAIDTVSQILHNRKETITFRKLKPAVEEMLKRNLTEKHLSQIKYLYPEAFNFQQEKLRVFGVGKREERWELVVIPNIQQESLTSELLLERRRKLFSSLIEKVKDYHHEFLSSLEPPMDIPREKITRWHPLFDIERVPDIEVADLPQAPDVEKMLTGKEVLDKARAMFSCNIRMERALERLKEFQEKNAQVPAQTPPEPTSVLKGIPKALLEKVRQRQAAKALESMTRSEAKDKEVQLYSRLPEIARFTRNLFVSEKKSVLTLDSVIDKLGNSYRSSLNKTEMEEHLKVISKEVPGWLVFHDIRNTVFLKLSKNADLTVVMNKLEELAKQKVES